MHSAEHILNQAMVRKFDCGRCFSAHVNKKKSKCDYHFDRDLTDDEANEVEAEVNQVISANLDVTEEIVSLEEAARNFNLTRLPEGARNRPHCTNRRLRFLPLCRRTCRQYC